MAKQLAERGTKRTCQACGVRFYDLNRDPISCPMCLAAYQVVSASTRGDSSSALAVAAEKAARKAPKTPVFADDDAMPETAVLPEGAEADDVVVPDAEGVAVEGEEETFLEQEEEDTDVTGFIDGGLEEPGEEET